MKERRAGKMKIQIQKRKRKRKRRRKRKRWERVSPPPLLVRTVLDALP